MLENKNDEIDSIEIIPVNKDELIEVVGQEVTELVREKIKSAMELVDSIASEVTSMCLNIMIKKVSEESNRIDLGELIHNSINIYSLVKVKIATDILSSISEDQKRMVRELVREIKLITGTEEGD